MKKFNILFSILLGMMVFIISCQDDSYDLGRRLDSSEIQFRVEQPTNIHQGGNTVVLINETPGTVPIWDYGTGRSNRMVDTIQYPFAGEYTIKLSVLTAGGVVDMEPVTIQVTENDFSIVEHPYWFHLTGGPGEEKTWLLDLNEEGVSKFFNGPVYFSSNNFDPDEECLEENGCWLWEAGWEGAQWIGPAGDYGTMTFQLEGGAFVTVDHKMIPEKGVQEGTFFIDTDAGHLMMTDALPLQNPWADNDVDDWSKLKIISLTDSTMQLAAWHGSKEEFLIFNYITKEYSDNWVPKAPVETGPDEGFDPEFASGELLTMLTGENGSGRIWKLDAAGNPVDWVAAGKGWTESHSSSRDWGWNDSWDAVAANSWVLFDQIGGTKNYTRNQAGTFSTGTFSIDEETNEITLTDNTLIQNPEHWMSPSTNVIKVVKAFPGEAESKGIWFGTGYDESKDEWLVFHYIIPSGQ